MEFPDLYELTLPMLAIVADGTAWSTRRLVGRLADAFALSDAQLKATRADGRLILLGRVERARMFLEKASLIECPGPQTARITSRGLQLLAAKPRRLSWEYFKASEGVNAEPITPDEQCPEALEDELRRLCGVAVVDERAWGIVRRINGWGPEPPAGYKRLAVELGVPVSELLELGKRCRVPRPDQAPLLDAALACALSRPNLDPDALSLDLAFAGITRGVITVPGLCEAARRFGREAEWTALIRYLADHRRANQRPRPFDSWFEIDVFLYLVGLGHHVVPQEKIGHFRVDILLPDFVPQVVIECDGDAFHGEDRRQADESREHWLQSRNFRVLRFRYSAFSKKPDVIKRGLKETLESLTETGLQLRLGA